jgi:DNA mismatch repair protein MutS2
LSPETIEAEALLEDIQRERDEAAEARQVAGRQAEEVERLGRRLRDELRQAERERREVLRQARLESEQMLAELRREAERRLRELSAAGADMRRLRTAAEAVRSLDPLPEPATVAEPEPEAEAADPGPAEVRPGAVVVVPRLGYPGTVLSVAANGDAELEVRGMRVRVRAAELAEARPANRRDRADATVTGRDRPVLVRAEAAPAAPPTQLDLRGLRREEAAETLDRYLNDAYLAGNHVARIIHGKGSGAVRAAVREQLSGHPLVKSFSGADPREGGDGATEVALAT